MTTRSLALASFALITGILVLACDGEAQSPDGMGGICKATHDRACPVPMQKIGNPCSCKVFDLHGNPLPDEVGTVVFQ